MLINDLKKLDYDFKVWKIKKFLCRAHDTAGKSSIYPQYGSGPQREKEFFSIDDYKEILEEAVKHHIRVIPEIDLPGHANAAIQSNLVKFVTDL